MPDGRGCPDYAVPGGARCRTHGGKATPSGQVTQTWRWRRFRRSLIASSPRPWVCGICGLRIESESQIEIDHRVPVSAGGDPWKRSNCQLAHRRCNRQKGASVRRMAGSRPGRPVAGGLQARLRQGVF